MPKQKNRSFAVIGLGTFGTTVSTELARFGNHILGVDTVERNVARVADTLAGSVIADGRDEHALREVGVGNDDVAIIAIGGEMEAKVVWTMGVKLLGVPTVWVQAMSRTHHHILTKLGADRVIHPERDVGRHVAQKLHNPLVRDCVSLGNGVHMVVFRVPERLDGKRNGDMRLRDGVDLRALGLKRSGEFISCDSGAPEMKTDDKLLLLGRRENLRRFGDSL